MGFYAIVEPKFSPEQHFSLQIPCYAGKSGRDLFAPDCVAHHFPRMKIAEDGAAMALLLQRKLLLFGH